MPNNITNRLTILGSDAEVKKVLAFLEHKPSKKIFKIFKKNKPAGMGTIDFNNITPMPKEIFGGDLGEKELKKYGTLNWYDWSIENWGTKWNAYYTPDNRSSDNVLYFTTANAAPMGLMQKLSKIFPDVTLDFAWTDDSITEYYVGMCQMKNGDIIEECIPEEGSYDARKMYVDILGGKPEDHGLDENYEYIDEDL